MRSVSINVQSNPTVSINLTIDDPQVLSALYHRLNIGSRRLLNARKIVNGEADGVTYQTEYGVSKEDVLAKDSPLQDIADALEPFV